MSLGVNVIGRWLQLLRVMVGMVLAKSFGFGKGVVRTDVQGKKNWGAEEKKTDENYSLSTLIFSTFPKMFPPTCVGPKLEKPRADVDLKL